MRTKKTVTWIGPGAVGAIVVGLVISLGNQVLPAKESTPQALTGSVTSTKDGRMQGVLVSAKREGTNVTNTVVSDASGAYRFPRTTLEPGDYTISVRAVGYVLPPTNVKVTEAPAVKNLVLKEASLLDKALQLSSAEWMMSYPIGPEATYNALRDCTRCHNQQRVAMSRFTEKELHHVMQRMTAYWLGSTPVTLQLLAATTPNWGRKGGIQVRPPSKLEAEQAAAVSAVNLSKGQWQYPLKTFPRPTGEDTSVKYTMYDLPRAAAKPHDVQVGQDGWIYYDDFNDYVLGKLNPKTGETKEWNFGDKFPQLFEEKGQKMTSGMRDLMSDGRGKFYITPPGLRGGEGFVIVFDTKTEQFELYPGGGHFVAPNSMQVDGSAWVYSGGGPVRVKFQAGGTLAKEVVPEKKLNGYDIYADSKNNVYGSDRGAPDFWKVDAKTFKVTRYPFPETRGETGYGGAGPRRGLFDRQDRLWYGGFDGGVIGKLDPSKPAESAIELYKVPMPWFQPYTAIYDENGYVWTGSIAGDYAARMNEKTGKWNFYLLPAETNVRQLAVQPSQNGAPSSLWIGQSQTARIVHVEPLGGVGEASSRTR